MQWGVRFCDEEHGQWSALRCTVIVLYELPVKDFSTLPKDIAHENSATVLGLRCVAFAGCIRTIDPCVLQFWVSGA